MCSSCRADRLRPTDQFIAVAYPAMTKRVSHWDAPQTVEETETQWSVNVGPGTIGAMVPSSLKVMLCMQTSRY
jgi:hypothetical protein